MLILDRINNKQKKVSPREAINTDKITNTKTLQDNVSFWCKLRTVQMNKKFKYQIARR